MVPPPPQPLLTTSMIKLNTENFLPWKRQIEIVLTLRGLDIALTQDHVDRRIDMQAMLVILESLDDCIQVQAKSTAKDIVRVLQQQYADNSANNKHTLLADFFGYKKISSYNMTMHFRRMKEMRARLISLGETISEDLFQVLVIRSLPEEHKNILND